MNVAEKIQCEGFPCRDIDTKGYAIPDGELDPEAVRMVMITEAPPGDPADGFHGGDDSFYMQTTINAFRDAGVRIGGLKDVLEMGIYITTAIKCSKTGYAVSAATIGNCSVLLEQELGLFPDVRAYMLNGDVAIKAFNAVAKRQTGKRVIPGGSTYKIRSQQYHFMGKRVFPSYVFTGKNYLIEKSKRRMIAEDLKNALQILGVKGAGA